MATSDKKFSNAVIPDLRRIIPRLFFEGILSGKFSDLDTLRSIRPVKTDMEVAYSAYKPFMRPGDKDPNEHYRPWLEEHVGVQGIDWNWTVDIKDDGAGVADEAIIFVVIQFVDMEKASLFQLKWP